MEQLKPQTQNTDKQNLQIQLLNRQFTNIEFYKSLRTKIPITIGGFIIALTGLLLKLTQEGKIDNNLNLLFISMIIIIGLGSMVAYNNIHKEYKRYALNIYHLYKKLGIEDEDFFREGEDPNKDPIKNMSLNIFRIGYVSILLISSVCCFIIYQYYKYWC